MSWSSQLRPPLSLSVCVLSHHDSPVKSAAEREKVIHLLSVLHRRSDRSLVTHPARFLRAAAAVGCPRGLRARAREHACGLSPWPLYSPVKTTVCLNVITVVKSLSQVSDTSIRIIVEEASPNVHQSS